MLIVVSLGNLKFNMDYLNRQFTDIWISGIFNNNARSTPYADVYRNALSDGRTQMFFALVSDRLFTGERQFSIINTLHDTGRGQTMLNQYGDMETVLDLGTFDYVIDGNESVLRYYPNKFKLNNF